MYDEDTQWLRNEAPYRAFTWPYIVMNRALRYCFALLPVLVFACDRHNGSYKTPEGRSYYLNRSGDDDNAGTRDHPWQTINKLNSVDLGPGDTVFFENGQTFEGTLQIDSTDSGNADHPLVITSHGAGKAIIDGRHGSGIVISAATSVRVENLHVVGSGRKEGNTQSGIVIENDSRSIALNGLDVEGFQKSGVLVHVSSAIEINNVYAHNNGSAGISVNGKTTKSDNRNIVIRHSRAENNPGDPTLLTNHSGNGIVVGLATNVLITYCTATNNGWDMPRIGNGPVGIWAYESDSVVIQHCISYRNKTSEGGDDGGGFDLDGGMTNSIVQYCLSFENQGSGFGIFQYRGASRWANNIMRFNISENDGLVSRARAGIFIWNGSDDAELFTSFYCYNNVIYNTLGSALHFDQQSAREDFHYYNNIFVAKDNLIQGISGNDAFLGNNWWSLAGGFNVNGERDLNRWANATGHERSDHVVVGISVDPSFEHFSSEVITDVHDLPAFNKYRLPPGSVLRTRGIDLKGLYGLDTGGVDFNGHSYPANAIGASF